MNCRRCEKELHADESDEKYCQPCEDALENEEARMNQLWKEHRLLSAELESIVLDLRDKTRGIKW